MMMNFKTKSNKRKWTNASIYEHLPATGCDQLIIHLVTVARHTHTHTHIKSIKPEILKQWPHCPEDGAQRGSMASI